MATFVPAIGHLQFVILSALLDGQPRSVDEIRQLQHLNSNGKLAPAIGTLSRSGLVERLQAVRRRRHASAGESPTYKQRGVYRITAAGRRAWQESIDFYVFHAERAQRNLPTADADPILSVRPAPLTTSPSSGKHRLPTPAEDQQLVKISTVEFARIYLAGRVSAAHFAQLAALDFEQVDLSAAEIPLPPHEDGVDALHLTDDLRRLLRDAGQGRTSGPMFLTPRIPGRWHLIHLSETFIRYRRAAGLPENVQLLGNTRSIGAEGRRIAAGCRDNGFLSATLNVAGTYWEPPHSPRSTRHKLSEKRRPTAAELKRLCDVADSRLHAAFLLTQQTDVSYGRLLQVDCEDIDLQIGMIHVRDRHGRPRTIPLTDRMAASAIAAYVGTRTTGPLFLANDGRRMTSGALLAGYKRCRIAAGLPKSVTLRGNEKRDLTENLRAKNRKAS